MKLGRNLGLGLVVGTLALTAGLAAWSQPRRRHNRRNQSEVTCTEGQHLSAPGHCCGRGEAWVEEVQRCFCIDPDECRRAEEEAARAAAEAARAADAGPPPLPPGTCPEGMVRVAGGAFSMGSPMGEGEADEQPRHEVSLSPYCIDRTEVTVADYRQCAVTGGCTAPYVAVSAPGLQPQDVQFFSTFCNGGRSDRDNHPVNCVDWAQASAYCRARNQRLPTEAEWEFAARGTDNRRFPWGNNPPDPTRLNACGPECRAVGTRGGRNFPVLFTVTDNWDTTAPVGSFAPGASPYGVMDLAGNVWEWTGDWYGPYSSGEASDPTGASSGAARVVRGGSWIASAAPVLRATDRVSMAPTVRVATLGFRCAMSLNSAPRPAPTPPSTPPPTTPPPAPSR